MAKRNRKHGHESHRGVFLGVAFVALVASVAMTYLSIHNTCECLGSEIKELESARGNLLKRVVNEEHNWTSARSIRNMESLMACHGIVMSWPAERDIIRVPAKELGEPAQYAYQNGLN